MTKTRIFSIVLITVLAIAVLAASGYGIYRLGYTQGLAASVGDLVGGRFSRGFGDRFLPDLPRGGFPMFGTRQVYSPFSFFRGIFGLILIGGIVALAVIGIKNLIQRSPSSEILADTSSPVDTMVKSSSEEEPGGSAKVDSSVSDA